MKKFILIIMISFSWVYIHTSEKPITEKDIFENKEFLKEKETICLIKAIVATIKHKESRGNYAKIGQSGEIGAYQYLRSTFNKYCMRYVGYILPMTPKNQDYVTYLVIKSFVSKNYTVEQIASIWNCGSPEYKNKIGINKSGVYYNVPDYVKGFMSDFNKIKKCQ